MDARAPTLWYIYLPLLWEKLMKHDHYMREVGSWWTRLVDVDAGDAGTKLELVLDDDLQSTPKAQYDQIKKDQGISQKRHYEGNFIRCVRPRQSLFNNSLSLNRQIWCQRNQPHMFHLTIQFTSKFIYSLRLRPYLTKIFKSTSFKNIIPLILIKIALTTNKFT